jgi:putative peptide zinc metalloprotease protein
MRFGTPSLQITSLLAKGLHRPRLRPDLVFTEQVLAGETSVIIQLPEAGSYVRYGPFEFELLQVCDGTRTAADIAATMRERHPDAPLAEEEVLEFLDGTSRSLWERSFGEKNLAVLEKIRTERKNRAQQSSLLYLTLVTWKTDKALERLHRYLAWAYSPGFVAFSLALFATIVAIIIGDYPRIRQDTLAFYHFTNKSAYDIWIFWFLTLIITAIHESGHGLTCKHYGGRVPAMGLMLMYFMPTFFTDCTSMCMFDRTSKRLITVFAGIWAELVFGGLATLVWYFSPPGSLLGDLGYKTLLLTVVSGVFMNLNPLIKLDGYYALAQYLEIENLREDSFDYGKSWVRRYVLRQRIDLPPATRHKTRIFLAYAAAAAVYGVLILLVVFFFAKNVFTSSFGSWGYPLTFLVIYLILRKRLRSAMPALRNAFAVVKEKAMVWKTSPKKKWVVLAVLIFLALPLRTSVSTQFILEPGAKSVVRAPVAGMVREIPVRDGERVAEGTVLAELANPEIEAREIDARAELDLASHSFAQALTRDDSLGIARFTEERNRWTAQLADAQTKLAGLVLRAPQAGVVAAPLLRQRVGEYLIPGESFAVIADRTTMKARVLVRDWQLEDVHLHAPVKLITRAYPFQTFAGSVEQIMPATASDGVAGAPGQTDEAGPELSNYVAVVMRFPNSKGLLFEGMTGTAKILGHRRPIAWHIARGVWRWVHSYVW